MQFSCRHGVTQLQIYKQNIADVSRKTSSSCFKVMSMGSKASMAMSFGAISALPTSGCNTQVFSLREETLGFLAFPASSAGQITKAFALAILAFNSSDAFHSYPRAAGDHVIQKTSLCIGRLPLPKHTIYIYIYEKGLL